MATILEKAKSLGKYFLNRLKPTPNTSTEPEKPDLEKSKELVLEIRYGGLGDHLYWSHIPRIAKKQGYKKVYVSNFSDFRNPECKKLVWEINPYVDGFIDKEGYYPIYKKADEGTNILDMVMLTQSLDDGKRFHDPELYYKPKIRPELKGKTVYDPNYVSNAGDDINPEKIEKYLQDHNIKIDYQMKLRDKSVPLEKVKNTLEAKNLEEFMDIIASCKKVYCLASGTATLASALGKHATVFYAKNLNPIFLHSKTHKYVLIK